LSSQFAACADGGFKFQKRRQLFIGTHNETLPASQDRARIVSDCQTADDPAMITVSPHNRVNVY
jgi:hypothetical protein